MDRLTKQGGPLSPLKSTMTTSLGHHYLDDLSLTDDGTLIIRSSKHNEGNPHLPEDTIETQVTMAEATDDLYIFAMKLPTLISFCLAMEHFQFVYSWLMQWLKTRLYVLHLKGQVPNTIEMESIMVKEGVHPWTVTKHAVPVIANELEFLCTKVDDPGSRFQALKEFIEFKFPKLVVKTPIILLWKIIAQCIISCCCALLSLQPVKQDQAIKLDHLIASKVHETLGFPYQAMTLILTLPLSLHSMGFPSIKWINAGLSIDGLNCDLKHHIPAYRNIARLTLADWTCSINNCTYPLDGKGHDQNFTHYLKCIPTAWIIALQYMGSNELRLALHCTNISYISSGDIAISHVLNLAKGQSIAVPDGHTM